MKERGDSSEAFGTSPWHLLFPSWLWSGTNETVSSGKQEQVDETATSKEPLHSVFPSLRSEESSPLHPETLSKILDEQLKELQALDLKCQQEDLHAMTSSDETRWHGIARSDETRWHGIDVSDETRWHGIDVSEEARPQSEGRINPQRGKEDFWRDKQEEETEEEREGEGSLDEFLLNQALAAEEEEEALSHLDFCEDGPLFSRVSHHVSHHL